MGRNKKKKTEDILQECCMLFWEKGYAQTSIKDIEKATGLQPGSIYHLFKTKDALYEQVVDHYISTIVQPRLQEFLQVDKGDGLRNIRRVFDSVIEIPCEYRWIGCLMTNTSVEVQQLPVVKKKIQMVFELFEEGFLKQLNRIPALKKKTSAERKKIAGSLLVSMEGFFVLVRLGSDDRQLKKYVDNALYIIKAAS